jgi:thioredoxin-like negative regulator of GroEL
VSGITAGLDNHLARYHLALHKVIGQGFETAMDLFLQLMQKDRRFGAKRVAERYSRSSSCSATTRW